MWEDKERMKKQTEEHLKNMPMALMKHFNGSSGMCSYRDSKYTLIDLKDPKTQLVFETINDLSDAGWTID